MEGSLQRDTALSIDINTMLAQQQFHHSLMTLAAGNLHASTDHMQRLCSQVIKQIFGAFDQAPITAHNQIPKLGKTIILLIIPSPVLIV